MIRLKYEMDGNWTTTMVTSTYGVSLWRAIRKLWQKLRENCGIKAENDMKISSWEDKWPERGTLRALFSDIYIINQQERVTVAEVWSNQVWNLSFRRLLSDVEIQRLADCFKILE